MLAFAIALLILFGIALLIIEFLVLPGTTIAFIGGIFVMGFGVFLAYKSYGLSIGNFTLLGTVILFIAALYYSLRSKTWKKMALHSEIDGKVNTIEAHKINIGDKGIAITRLGPIGKVQINDIIVEAKSTGIYITENTEIEVLKVNESNIIVKPLK